MTTILEGIWGFSPADIWVVNDLAIHREGQNWKLYDVRLIPGFDSLSLDYCWGTNSTNMYFAGRNGSMAHFDGTSWQKMELGTRRTITDVCGSPDGSMIWALVTNPNQPYNLLFGMERTTNVWRLAYDGTVLQYRISFDSLSGGMNGIYAPDPQTVFVCSSAGLYRVTDRGSTLPRAERMSFTTDWFPGYPWKLRGNSATDMFIVGERAFVAHYNGRSVRFYDDLYNPNLYLYSVSCKGDLVMAVGEDYDPIDSKGLVIWGRRLPK